jgi:predicted TIM-barrel fold metal-dependent hydrolase
VEYVVQQPVPAGVMAGIVAHADLRRGDAVEEVLDAHEQAAEGRLRGIRHSTAWDADERLRFTTTSSPGVMLEPAFQRGAAVLAARGLALDCFLYGHQLDEMVSLAQAVPDLSLVLDHLGTPLVVGAHAARRDEVRDQWRGSMTALAACSNVVVKVGGLGMALMGAPWRGPARPSSDDIAAHWSSDVQWCIDLFGPARCMFESNFPVDRLLVDYVALWNAFKLMSASYSASERGALMHDTAARVYKLSYEDGQ